MISMTPRKHIPLSLTLLTPAVAIFLTLAVGATIFGLLGFSPFNSILYVFCCANFASRSNWGSLCKGCPLIIIATGLVFVFERMWNIGAEGQLIFGAIFSGWVALNFPDWPSITLMPAMVLASIIGGMCWAMIPALLKVRFNTNEILVSLMLTYVAALFIDWLVRGPWRDPMSFGFPLTKMYSDAALIQRIDLPFIGTLGQLHWGVVGALFWRLPGDLFCPALFWGSRSR